MACASQWGRLNRRHARTCHTAIRWRAFTLNRSSINIIGHEIRCSIHELPIWHGAKIKDTYGNKAVLDFHGTPVFAELFALREFWKLGFDGVWVDTFRRRFRTQLPETNEPEIILPEFVDSQFSSIIDGASLSGVWDLLLWRNESIFFVELKRSKKDQIRDSQISFLERAINKGILPQNFEIYEWDVKV